MLNIVVLKQIPANVLNTDDEVLDHWKSDKPLLDYVTFEHYVRSYLITKVDAVCIVFGKYSEDKIVIAFTVKAYEYYKEHSNAFKVPFNVYQDFPS